jgi:hypothetical protein
MARHAAPALLFALACASCGEGFARCDELDRACDRPLQRASQTARQIRARAPRLPELTAADLRSVVVTGYDTYDEDGTGRVGNLFFQELSPAEPGATDRWSPCPLVAARGLRVCALSVFAPQLAPAGFRPVAGDVVDVSGGGYTEFTCAPCGREFEGGRFIPQISRPTITSVGVAPAPVPVPVTLDELVAHNDALVGNLVTVTDLVVGTDPDRFNEVAVGMNVKLSFQMFPSAGFTTGARLRRVTGIAYYFYGPKLIPRSVADIERAE